MSSRIRTALSIGYVLILCATTYAQEFKLHDAAWDGDINIVKAMIEADPKLISARDDYERGPLHCAARGGHADLVRYLLSKGADVDSIAYNSFTPLHLTSSPEVARILIEAGAEPSAYILSSAARYGKWEKVKLLMELGQPIDLLSAIELGWTDVARELIEDDPEAARKSRATARAAYEGQMEIVRLLVSQGADVNSGDPSPLVSACWQGHREIITYLLEQGANPNTAWGGSGSGELMTWAVGHDDTYYLELFLEHGADPNLVADAWSDGLKPLHTAAYEGRAAAASLLIQNGAPVNVNVNGLTPLHLGASEGHAEVVAVLINAGADVNPGLDTDVIPPIIRALARGHLDVAVLLTDAGAGIDIHVAAALGRSELVGALLDADPTRLEHRDDCVGRTAIAWAVANGQRKVVDMLLTRGANPNCRTTRPDAELSMWFVDPIPEGETPTDDVGETPLHLASARGDARIVDTLLAHGADVSARLPDGKTALHVAAVGGHLDVVERLINGGADLHSGDDHGATPLHTALAHESIVKFLLAAGADPNRRVAAGPTPIAWAARNDVAVAQVLIDAGAELDIFTATRFGQVAALRRILDADPSLANAVRERWPVQPVLSEAAATGQFEVAEVLLQYGADPDQRGRSYGSPLYESMRNGHPELAKLLLDHGADVDGTKSFAPVYAASRMESNEMIQILVEKGADVHVSGKWGFQAIHTAAGSNRVGALQVLLDAGVDVNVSGKCDAGDTPLHYAVRGAAIDAVNFLLANGADPLRRNYRSDTPLSLAEDRRQNGDVDFRGMHRVDVVTRAKVAEILDRHAKALTNPGPEEPKEKKKPTIDLNFIESTSTSSEIGPQVISRNILQDRTGGLWIASWSGILRHDGSTFINVTNKEGLRRHRAFSLLEDRDDNIWIGTIGAGVYRYDGNAYTNITKADGLAEDVILSMMQDRNGDIWFGSLGVTRYDGSTFTSFAEKDGFTNADVNSISEARDGTIWFGTRNALFRYDGDTFTNFTKEHRIRIDGYIPTMIDRKGHLWFGGDDGLYHYDGDKLTHVFEAGCFSLMEDSRGDIWFSGDWNNRMNVLNQFDPGAGLQDIDAARRQFQINTGMLFGITEDTAGRIWVGTSGGIVRIDGDFIRYFVDDEPAAEEPGR